jgi:hypothetical protein
VLPFLAIDDPTLDGAHWTRVKAAVPPHNQGASVLFIADDRTLTHPDKPLLVVDLVEFEGKQLTPFPCTPATLFDVQTNLNITNLDWANFADNVDPDGVFRGFAG